MSNKPVCYNLDDNISLFRNMDHLLTIVVILRSATINRAYIKEMVRLANTTIEQVDYTYYLVHDKIKQMEKKNLVTMDYSTYPPVSITSKYYVTDTLFFEIVDLLQAWLDHVSLEEPRRGGGRILKAIDRGWYKLDNSRVMKKYITSLSGLLDNNVVCISQIEQKVGQFNTDKIEQKTDKIIIFLAGLDQVEYDNNTETIDLSYQSSALRIYISIYEKLKSLLNTRCHLQDIWSTTDLVTDEHTDLIMKKETDEKKKSYSNSRYNSDKFCSICFDQPQVLFDLSLLKYSPYVCRSCIAGNTKYVYDGKFYMEYTGQSVRKDSVVYIKPRYAVYDEKFHKFITTAIPYVMDYSIAIFDANELFSHPLGDEMQKLVILLNYHNLLLSSEEIIDVVDSYNNLRRKTVITMISSWNYCTDHGLTLINTSGNRCIMDILDLDVGLQRIIQEKLSSN